MTSKQLRPIEPEGNSRRITTNQEGVHEQVAPLVKKYLSTKSQRPIQAHTQEAFEQVAAWLGDGTNKIILDSCCGIGESTAILAKRFPGHRVVGIDKSAQRIGKHQHHFPSHPDEKHSLLITQDNYCVVRADVNDFWRLANAQQWRPEYHFLLYPNPYPKASQVQKRWYASAAIKDLLLLGGKLEVRSNWQLYLEDFKAALEIAGSDAELVPVDDSPAMTPFERKYSLSGQTCWRLISDLSTLNAQSWQWDD